MACVRFPARMAPVLAFFALWLSAAPAAALPVTLYADHRAVSGFAPLDVAAAITLGAPAPAPVTGLIGGAGYFEVTTPDGIPGVHGKNRSHPTQGSSVWTLLVSAETPAELLGDFHLVILGHDRRQDPMRYKTKKVGLEISTSLPWRLVDNAHAPGMTHLAYSLGDVEAGGVYEIPIEYRFAGKLKRRNGEYVFPRYTIAFLSAPLDVPEPGTLALLGAALAAFGAARRRVP